MAIGGLLALVAGQLVWRFGRIFAGSPPAAAPMAPVPGNANTADGNAAGIQGRVVDAQGAVPGAGSLAGSCGLRRQRRSGPVPLAECGAGNRHHGGQAGLLHCQPTGRRRSRTSSPLELRLERPVGGDEADYAWVDPVPDAQSVQNCGNCHQAIYDQWQASGHAAGLANRHFVNLYEGSDWHGRPGRGWSLLDEHPHGAGVCGSCHTPAADLNDPASDDIRNTRGLAARGVQCDFCHKVQEVTVDRVGWQHGRFAMTLQRPAGERQVFFGPLDDAARGDDAYSPLQSESRFCAACHEGILFGVPVYTTYSEWLASPARQQGKQCQSCHMAPDGQLTNVAPGKGGIERAPETLASHDLLPGSRAAMLRRAIRLEVETLAPPAGNETPHVLRVSLRTEGVGHWLPTGFVDRHLILSIVVRDAEGSALDVPAGPRLPPAAGRALAGKSGVLLARLLTDLEGNAPAPFWRAGVTVSDTRLRPSETAESRYTLPNAAATVEVRLVFRRFWQEVASEKDWPSDEIVVAERILALADPQSSASGGE